MNLVVLALQVALVIVFLLVVWELMRLRRAALLSQISMPDLEEARRVEQAIREAGTEARNQVARAAKKLEDLSARVEHPPSEEPPDEPAEESEAEPVEIAEEAPEAEPRRAPRVLSEAGRAKYDRVLQLAAQGMDTDSIAGVVDLTRAEVELMLGPNG